MSTVPADKFGPLCDASLVSIAWEPAGPHLTIQLILGNGVARRFSFTWVNELRISIQQDRGTSQPLSWDGSAEQLPKDRIKVLIDFGQQGEISFECEQIMVDGS